MSRLDQVDGAPIGRDPAVLPAAVRAIACRRGGTSAPSGGRSPVGQAVTRRVSLVDRRVQRVDCAAQGRDVLAQVPGDWIGGELAARDVLEEPASGAGVPLQVLNRLRLPLPVVAAGVVSLETRVL